LNSDAQSSKDVQHGTKIDRKLADYIAMGMKEWALSKGVTHYTHWFQPLTGTTAEKHDAFFCSYDGSIQLKNLWRTISSTRTRCIFFPNGGIRNTFEARGYTAWDPTSSFLFWNNFMYSNRFHSRIQVKF
jgi:glutamine synthetase